MAVRVFTAEQVAKALEKDGWVKTEHETKTSEIWKKGDTHIQLPKPPYGGYPDWMIVDILGPLNIPLPPPLSNSS